MAPVDLHFVVSPSAGVREPVDDGGGLRVDGGVADVLGPDGGGREVGRDRGNLIEARGPDPGNVVVEREGGDDGHDAEDGDEREKLPGVDHGGSMSLQGCESVERVLPMPIIEAVAGTGVVAGTEAVAGGFRGTRISVSEIGTVGCG